ncbi:MAG TPA: lysylphosphatidylglycerol synthase transmembrane domain-containing protein [Anaerolineales bacterium]|nr:lysylphosphatidylglycerol synthase transmembrane domain-containing protein [Anaerolineales bacterium]
MRYGPALGSRDLSVVDPAEASPAIADPPRAWSWIAHACRWAIGLGLLVLAFRQVDAGRLLASIRHVDAVWLLITFATVVLGIGLKGFRWKLLLRSVCPERPSSDVMGALLTGQAANILLPLRGGEAVRAMMMVPPSDGRTGAVLVGIGIEKAFDGLALAVVAALTLPLLPVGVSPQGATKLLAVGALLLAVAIGVGFLSPRAWARLRLRLGVPSGGVRDRLKKWLNTFSSSLEQLMRSGDLLPALLATFVIWSVMLATNLALLRALGFPVAAGAAAMVLVAVHVALAPALMPGNMGPFYFAVEFGLLTFGYAPELAALYAILLHALVTIVPLLGAAMYLAAVRRRSGR